MEDDEEDETQEDAPARRISKGKEKQDEEGSEAHALRRASGGGDSFMLCHFITPPMDTFRYGHQSIKV